MPVGRSAAPLHAFASRLLGDAVRQPKELGPDGEQRVSAGSGNATLSWQLTAPYGVDEGSLR